MSFWKPVGSGFYGTQNTLEIAPRSGTETIIPKKYPAMRHHRENSSMGKTPKEKRAALSKVAWAHGLFSNLDHGR
jgi:hypothetical protein